MIKPDTWIKKMATEVEMISPFEEKQIKKGNISYGLSSFGYDIRIHDTFKTLRSEHKNTILDPKKIDPNIFKDVTEKELIIPSNSYILARSLEYFKIPRNVLVLTTGKSTYARVGVIVNVTPLEPSWEGYITMSISNTSNTPVKIYANEGIAQLVFLESNETCETSYSDRKGNYQAQKEITLPK